jgi:hypothetical protein
VTAHTASLDRAYLSALSLDGLADLLTTSAIVLRRVERVAGATGDAAYRCTASRLGTVVSVHGSSVLDAILTALDTGSRRFGWFGGAEMAS